jgi:hypothetical protein
MAIKDTLVKFSVPFVGLIGNARAATNGTGLLFPDASKGREHLAELPYVDKLQYVLDIVFAIVPIIALGALGWLTIMYLAGGWDSVENELRVRKKYFSVIGILLALKVGSAAVRLIDGW